MNQFDLILGFIGVVFRHIFEDFLGRFSLRTCRHARSCRPDHVDVVSSANVAVHVGDEVSHTPVLKSLFTLLAVKLESLRQRAS